MPSIKEEENEMAEAIRQPALLGRRPITEKGRRGGKRRRERDARAGKVTVDTEHGRGNLGGGGERGDQSHQWDNHT